MHKFIRIVPLFLLVTPAGCSGGGGGGLSLSGGSIPTGGGGSIKGLAVLPNAQPLTGATVSVRALATGQAVTGAPVLNPDGTFTVTGVPVGEDLEVVFQQAAGATLKVVVPRALLPAPSPQPVDVGTVNASTTVVAQSLERETSQNPEQAAQIVSDQTGPLTSSLGGENQNQDDQETEIEDGGQLTAAAQTLIRDTANAELQALASGPSAATALHGLVAQIGETRGTPIHLMASQQSALIAAQLAGTTYPANVLATDLQASGTTASAADVTAADQTQRAQLPAWTALGVGIGAFESLTIATSPAHAGGFALSQTAANQFLTLLLGS